jgi:glutaryl-CoA dehydrogenase
MTDSPSTWAQLRRVTKQLDLGKVLALARQIDLGRVLETLSTMEPEDLAKLSRMLGKRSRKKTLPRVDGDFYDVETVLDAEERSILLRVRKFMNEKVRPVVNDYWLRGEFPHDLVPEFAKLDVAGLPYRGYGCPGRTFLLEGLVAQEIARVDVSLCTFLGVQSGLAMGSIYLCGSEEQKQRWLPAMREFKKIGAFGLTEPDVGSGAAGGLTTTCRREGDGWILDGKKRWIGNGTFADVVVVWARDVADGEVKGFLVEKGTPGFSSTKMVDKMALRIVQNAELSLESCKVPDSARLPNANGFKDTASVLRMTRAGVAWQAVGCARGAYEHAVTYCQERRQFGRPIGSFQLVQELLAQMLAQLTAMQTMVVRLSQLQDQGMLKDEHASLAKVFCTSSCRDVVSHARELLGGNGILLSYDVARFVADAEAIYSYEGTAQVNSLIVGRAITGYSAFV